MRAIQDRSSSDNCWAVCAGEEEDVSQDCP